MFCLSYFRKYFHVRKYESTFVLYFVRSVLSYNSTCTVRGHLQMKVSYSNHKKCIRLAPPLHVGSWEKRARRGRVFSLKSTKVRVRVNPKPQNNLGKGPQGRVFAYGAPNAFHWLSSVGPEKCLRVDGRR